MKTIKQKLAIGLCALCVIQAVQAKDSEPSATASALGSELVVLGSAATLSTLAASSALVIAAVEPVGESVTVVLKSASDAGEISIHVARDVVKEVGVSVGNTISVVSEATGYALVASGKVLAFIPNALGKELLHHSKSVVKNK